MSLHSRFPVPRLFPSLSTPYSRLVSRRRGEGSTNEERDDRDETRNTGDDQGSVCKVGTQDPENLDEELKPLVTVWSRLYPSSVTRVLRSCFTPSTRAGGGPSRNVERRGTRRYERNGVEEVRTRFISPHSFRLSRLTLPLLTRRRRGSDGGATEGASGPCLRRVRWGEWDVERRDMTAIYFHNLISLHVSQINSCHILYLQYMRLLTPTPLSIIFITFRLLISINKVNNLSPLHYSTLLLCTYYYGVYRRLVQRRVESDGGPWEWQEATRHGGCKVRKGPKVAKFLDR